jgi:hypothetical protein
VQTRNIGGRQTFTAKALVGHANPGCIESQLQAFGAVRELAFT